LNKIDDWKGVYRNPPATLPCYCRKENIKDQVFFDTWKPLLKHIHAIQKETYNTYGRLWNNSDDILEEFKMPLMPPIDEAKHAKIRIVEVEKNMKLPT